MSSLFCHQVLPCTLYLFLYVYFVAKKVNIYKGTKELTHYNSVLYTLHYLVVLEHLQEKQAEKNQSFSVKYMQIFVMKLS